ncbi:MAG: molybdopterin-dependent oxidoreductase [Desulfarculaceae bacterium]|jgi:aldehyde oxidoreductase
MRKVTLKINGSVQDFIIQPEMVLLDLLREDLNLTGAKQSCDRKGQCGACTVIVGGKAVRSCLVKVKDLDKAEVITVEGLGTPDNPHLIQEAFVLAGAIQCGFCTPGMIMSAKALLDTNPDPSVEDIKKAFKRNLCRCTGYQKIIEAVQMAGRFLRGEASPDEVRPKPGAEVMGVSHPRPSALAKACGTARFTADIKIKGALEIAVVRSELPHAKIVSIDSAAAENMPGVVGVMTAKDIKGTNRIKQQRPDQPVLCEDRVRLIGDPIVAVAAATKEQAEAAAKAVKVDLEPLPTLNSVEEAMAEGAIQLYDEWPNQIYDQPQIKGDAEAALAESAVVVEASFSTQLTHQAPLETEVTAAYWEGEGQEAQLVILGRSINIHFHLGLLQEALGWENMRYEEAYTGGQFGIKAGIISEGIAGAAALHFKRPIRYIPGLAESFVMTSKRHPYAMNAKMGADAKGNITAYCNDFLVEKGAYFGNGANAPLRSLMMLSGSYNIPNIKARARMAYTNNPYGAAARGAGPPQSNFALESIMDMVAAKLGVDPFEFRLKNSLKPGQSNAIGWAVEQWPFPELMEAVRPHYDRAVKEAADHKDGRIKRGVGLGAGSFGIGSPGDTAIAAVELDPDGGVSVYAAAADPGEGNDSMLSQLTAKVMGVPLEKIRLHTRNTDNTTATGPAAGSRITYMVGGAVVNALEQLKAAMAETGAADSEQLKAAGKPIRYVGRKKTLEVDALDPVNGQGPSFDSEVHAVQMAEVEVDIETGKVRVIKMTTAVDAGPVINPQTLSGQLEGGMDMGVGYALREEYITGKTNDWLTFKFPTIGDSFPMEVIMLETPRIRGALGCTGVGEMCMVPTAPAVTNAIANATGARIFNLPATPDKVKAALCAAD